MLPLINISQQQILGNVACMCILIDFQNNNNNRYDVVLPALRQLAVTIIMKSNDKNWQWLYVVPLYHFMIGLSSPYEPIPLDKEIKWKFWCELESVRKKQQSNRLLYILVMRYAKS